MQRVLGEVICMSSMTHAFLFYWLAIRGESELTIVEAQNERLFGSQSIVKSNKGL